MPLITTTEGEFFYEAQGSGEPVLLIAGFASDHQAWSAVVPELAARYEVIAFDNRGVGRTTADVDALTLRQLADDVSALIDVLDLKRVHVAGHSMGGQIAQELALAHPDQVRSLMLISSCARPDARGKAIIELWGDLPQSIDAATVTRIILPWTMTNRFFDTPGAVERFIAEILANPHPPTLEGLYGQSRAISACDTVDRIGAVRCPTLVLTGREDIVFPLPFSEELRSAIRGAELVVLENAGHGLLVETPNAVARVLLEFLGKASINGQCQP
jgi:3-oxoadipate enol-lactonase